MGDTWQLQEAKQRFSQLVRAAETAGPQVVTRHGKEVAVVIEADAFRRLKDDGDDFKAFLRSAPDLDGLDIARSTEPARRVDLA